MEINVGIKYLFNLFFYFGVLFINNVHCTCDWPSEFQTTQWHDSSRGVITFQVTTLDGWSFSPTSGTVVTSWDCVKSDTYDSDGRLIFITANSFELFSTNYYAYVCITITKVTDYSYRYYMNKEMQGNLNNERVFLYPVNTLTDPGTICSSSGASGGEYQFWVKVGNEAQTKLDCPWSILGQYGYIHTSSSGQTSCDITTSELDMCTDPQHMSLDYSTCLTKVTYSVSNTVWCVDNIPVGTTNYAMLFNGNDADADIDNATVYRYTCMAVSGSLDIASVSPKYCQNGQVPDQYPVTTSGLQLGGLLSFSAARVSCPTCPDLFAPTYGDVEVSTVGSLTSALYTCDTNYTLWGTSTRICEDTDFWSDSEPACSCAHPVEPDNGTVSVNANGSEAVYTCTEGFTLNGPTVRYCQLATATWEGDDPTCVQCDSFATIAGQTSSLSTTGTITSASFVCVAGFTLSGIQSMTCVDDGTWNATQPDCVSCEVLTNPASGTLGLVSDGSVSTVNYACATDYTLQGDTTRTCQLNGTWDGSAPTCSCDQPNSPTNGAVVANSDTATYTCNVGFTLNGDSTRTCQTDGSGWSGANPSCSQCNSLSTVTGGSYSLSTTGTTTSATYSCQVGYSLDGTSTISCMADGSWGTASPTCVQCQTLTDPTSGTVTLTTSGTKTTATYACASEYNLNGNTIRLCNSDGTWTLVEPTCTCKSPTTPLNGELTEDGETASYTCNEGYSLNGLTTRTCGADGSGWSGNDPTCSTCATLTSPTGGTVQISTDGYNTQASYTCDSGYTLNGVSPITCRSDGTWDFTAPSCARCPDIVAPDSGSMTISSDGVSTTVTFSCQSGYYLVGEYTITCGSDGVWSDSAPSCKCNFPDTPNNGDVSVTGSSQGPLASYTCDTGYSLNGLAERVCMSDGTGWEDADPTCNVCQTVSIPTSGTFNLITNGTHTSVTYSCDVGSTLSGDSEQVCFSSGSWESVAPTCVTCPTLTDPNSGSITYSISSSATIATYSCVTGYSLSSTSTLTCLTSGSWDITSPYCICQSPSLISNGELTITDNLSTATYDCYTGYVMVGSNIRYCQDDGTGWSGVSPVCELSSPTQPVEESEDDTSWKIHIAVVVVAIVLFICLVILLAAFIHLYLRLRQNNSRVSSAASRLSKEPDDPENSCNILNNPVGGSYTLSSNGTTTFSNYSCIAGYSMVGEADRTCQTDQTWGPSAPYCVQCETLDELSSGSISITTDGFISTATYSCTSGHRLIGISTRFCQTDGTWNGTKPLCECDSPNTPLNGAVVSNGATANYSCMVNHTLSGSQIRTCGTDGSGWSGTDPVCSVCQSINVPDGGTLVMETTGSQTYALFTCLEGYTIDGAYKVYCQSDGSWDTLPTCATCATLTAPDSGSVSTYITGYITMATYVCSSGYDLNGDSTRACLTDGSWNLQPPTCTCQSPASLQNGNIVADGVTATYTCDVGYSLAGTTTRTCATDGSGWSESDPACNQCDALSDPVGGNVTLATDGINTVATHICHVGYILTGSDVITCISDGSWDDSQPQCDSCPTLTAPSSGSVVMDTDSKTTTATFSCVTGYYVSGEQILTCQASGQWNYDPPSCKCITPSTPSHGSVYVSDTTQGPVATYQCELEYSIDGLTNRLCLSDGTGWEGSDPVCSQCSNVTITDGLQMSTDTNGTMTTAEYTCSVNNTLSGQQEHICLTDGSWNYPPPTCVECSILTHPDSGSVTLSTSGTITTATYSCSSGYDAIGQLSLTCQTNGQWNYEPPTCKCITPSTPSRGSVYVSDTTQGPVATYQCDLGYSIDGLTNRLCLSDGTGWEGSDPVCSQCSNLTVTDGLEITRQTNGTVTTADCTCSVNYTLSGQREHTCLPDGTWNNSPPTCVECSILTHPDSGSVTLSTTGTITTATYSCSSGYYVNGAITLICQTDGQWNDSPPICRCVTPSAPQNGSVSVSDTSQGPVANYLCDTGYSIQGMISRQCLDDGTGWDGSDPSCNQCSQITTPQELQLIVSSNGSSSFATYACALNYSLSGEHEHTCSADGTWNFAQPTCVMCSGKQDPLSGTVTMTTDGLNTIATFSCLKRYSLNSTATVTCLTNGTWDNPDPFCVCDPPNDITNGEYSLLSHGMIANFTCNSGYELVGPTLIWCLPDGTGWNDTYPVCDSVDATTSAPSQKTDDSILSIPIGALVGILILVVLLVVLLVILGICYRNRLRKERQRISATFNTPPVDKPLRESTRLNFEAPDIENGTATLITKEDTNKNAKFNPRLLKKKPVKKSVRLDNRNVTTDGIKQDMSKPPPVETIPNGLSPKSVPLSSVRLPKLPPRSGKNQPTANKVKRKRRRVQRREIQENSSPEHELNTTSSTPVELIMNRLNTPDILASAKFDYIQPQFCHEVQTPSPTRPNTSYLARSTTIFSDDDRTSESNI